MVDSSGSPPIIHDTTSDRHSTYKKEPPISSRVDVALPNVLSARVAATDLAAASQSLGIFLFFRKSHIGLPFVNAVITPIDNYQLIFPGMRYRAVFWYQTQTADDLHFFRGWNFPLCHSYWRFLRPNKKPNKKDSRATYTIDTATEMPNGISSAYPR